MMRLKFSYFSLPGIGTCFVGVPTIAVENTGSSKSLSLVLSNHNEGWSMASTDHAICDTDDMKGAVEVAATPAKKH